MLQNVLTAMDHDGKTVMVTSVQFLSADTILNPTKYFKIKKIDGSVVLLTKNGSLCKVSWLAG